MSGSMVLVLVVVRGPRHAGTSDLLANPEPTVHLVEQVRPRVIRGPTCIAVTINPLSTRVHNLIFPSMKLPDMSIRQNQVMLSV